MKKHRKEWTYNCIANGCDRRVEGGFYRLDKLKDHTRTAHDVDTLFHCPEAYCGVGSLTRDVMELHCAQHWSSESDEVRMWCALHAHACPLQGCKEKPVTPTELLQHLRTHVEQERTAQSAAIAAAGYDAITCEVVCPMCGQKFVAYS